jgi:hypothetical protein
VICAVQLIVAQSRNQRHRASFRVVSDRHETEIAPTQVKSGSPPQDGMRCNLDQFQASIKTGGKQ